MSRTSLLLAFGLPLASATAACATSPDPSAPASGKCILSAEAALLAVHERARAAHLTGNAKILADDSAAQVVSAQNGRLSTSTREEIAARFEKYFNSVRYSEWRDVAPPQVSISGDGTLGWLGVAIEATVHPHEYAGKSPRFRSSWIATYQRDGCSWDMTAISSQVVTIETTD